MDIFYAGLSNDNCYIYERTLDDEKYVIVCNFEKENILSIPYKNCQIILSNYQKKDLNSFNRKYLPYELAVYKVE